MVDNTLLKQVGGEFICTLIFILSVCASSLSMSNSENTGNSGDITGAVCTTLTALAIIFVFGGVSGAHFNPAVTLGLMVLGLVKPIKGLLYILAQMLAGILSTSLLLLYYDDLSQLIFSNSSDEYWNIFILEFILTSILVFVIGMRVWNPSAASKKEKANSNNDASDDEELGYQSDGSSFGIANHQSSTTPQLKSTSSISVKSLNGAGEEGEEQKLNEKETTEEKIKSAIDLLITAGTIACTLGFLCFVGGQLGDAYFNPARLFGPIISNSMSAGDSDGWDSSYIHLLGNVCGSVFGAVLCIAFKS